MKIVCICSDESSINRIVSGLDGQHEVVLVIEPQFGSTGRRRKTKRRTLLELTSKVWHRIFFKFAKIKPSAKKIDQYFLDQSLPLQRTFDAPVEKIAVGKINDASTAELIAGHQPDVLFVCGAPILKSNIFEIPKYGSVNFHFGYSPKYCGQHTLLWPFISGDYENLGGTFLKIDKGVDTGAPLAFVFPEIVGSDTIETIEAKVADLAHSQTAKVLDRLADGKSVEYPTAEKQLQIRFKDYGPWVHLSYYWRMLSNRFLRRGSVLRSKKTIIAG